MFRQVKQFDLHDEFTKYAHIRRKTPKIAGKIVRRQHEVNYIHLSLTLRNEIKRNSAQFSLKVIVCSCERRASINTTSQREFETLIRKQARRNYFKSLLILASYVILFSPNR